MCSFFSIKTSPQSTIKRRKWDNWLAKIQEYDIEIKLLHVIKGQGLCKIIFGSDSLNKCISITIGGSTSAYDWYKDIILYLKSWQFPNDMSSKERRTLKIISNQYVLVAQILLHRNFDEMLLRCVDVTKSQYLIK
jgi:hypothetical protein